MKLREAASLWMIFVSAFKTSGADWLTIIAAASIWTLICALFWQREEPDAE